MSETCEHEYTKVGTFTYNGLKWQLAGDILGCEKCGGLFTRTNIFMDYAYSKARAEALPDIQRAESEDRARIIAEWRKKHPKPAA